MRKLSFETVNVDVENPFGATSIDVKKPERLCNPTNKNGEDPAAPLAAEHLVSYRTRQTEPRRVELERGLTVTNQFGTLLVDAKKPDIFMVPSAKGEAAPPAPLPTPLPLDHYECCRVRDLVFVSNAFGNAQGLDFLTITRPTEICVPSSITRCFTTPILGPCP